MLKNTSLVAAFSAITLCSVSVCNAEEILKPEVGPEENIAIEKKEGVVPCCQVNPDTKIFKNLFGLRSLLNKTSSIFGGKSAEKLDLTDPSNPNFANKVDANGLPLPNDNNGGGSGGADRSDAYARNSSINMFGDAFSGGGSSSSIARPNIIGKNVGGILNFTAGPSAGQPVSFAGLNNPNIPLYSLPIANLALQTTNLTTGAQSFTPSQPVPSITLVNAENITIQGPFLTYTHAGNLPTTVNQSASINENSFVTSVVTNSLNPGESIASNTNQFTLVGIDPTTGALIGIIGSNYAIFVPQAPLVVSVPSPASGGVVGRTKIADDNSPMPRDRLIFSFDYFNNVPLIDGGFDVYRYNLGFEKTFLDRRASIQVLFPIASTLDSNLTSNDDSIIGSRNTEFGNMSIALKYLFARNENWNFAGGLGFSLPTAPGTNLSGINGTPILEIKNQSVILTPYVAALFTPTKNFFAQSWMAWGFDTNGNTVNGFQNGNSSFQKVGKLNNTSFMQVDAQIGYWVINPDDSNRRNLRGLAPFLELHYNGSMGDYDTVQSGMLSIRDNLGNYNELNLAAGFVTQIRDDLNVNIGAVVPLTGTFDRHFDYQVGVHVNYFFGATQKARYANRDVSGF